jgi:hypothetical protein
MSENNTASAPVSPVMGPTPVQWSEFFALMTPGARRPAEA